jgi:hypothetical protein
MAVNRKTLRQQIIQSLYAPRYPTKSTTTSAGGTTAQVIDTILSPAGLTVDFVNAWIYIVEAPGTGPPIFQTRRCTQVDFSGSTNTITIDPVWTVAVLETGKDYEIHYVFYPEEINRVINDIIRDGSRGALSAIPDDDDSTTTIFERDVIVDGALYILKRRLSMMETGQEAFRLKRESLFHEGNYRSGLIIGGYKPLPIHRFEGVEQNDRR